MEVFRWILSLGVNLEVDLFASLCNKKLERYYSKGWCHQTFGTDAPMDHWNVCRASVFSPVLVILRFLQRLRAEDAEMVAVILCWLSKPCFPLLVQFSYWDLIPIALRLDLLLQGSVLHPCSAQIHMMIWFLRRGGWRPSAAPLESSQL